jgi:tetratricopeptide (TPR) repeat protein
VKRLLGLLAAVALLAVGGVLVEQRIERDRHYRELLASGESRLGRGDTAKAIEDFSGALGLRPDSMAAHLRRGEAYRAEGRGDDAERDLVEAARLAPDSTAPALALGDLYNARENWALAATWYGQAALRLQDQALLYKLALARYRSGAAATAIDPLQRIVARDDAASQAYYLLGLAFRDSRHPDEAIRALERAVRSSPSMLPAREELADLYRAQNRPVDEMAQLQALAVLDNRPARAVAIGLAQSQVGQFDAGIATLTDAARNNPASVPVATALSRVLLARADRGLDRPSAVRALAILSSPPVTDALTSESLALRGRAEFLSGDWSGAERTLTSAVQAAPVDVEAFAFLADTAERLGHDRAARDALASLDALEGDTARPDTRATRARRMGLIDLRLSAFADAAKSLGLATDLGQRDASTLALLAQARWQAGDRAAARTALASATAADPRNADVVRVARLVR